jgi:dihydroorotate dehydrogenase
MADLSTQWLGLSLKSPLVVAASPLSKDPQAIADAVARAPARWCSTRSSRSS